MANGSIRPTIIRLSISMSWIMCTVCCGYSSDILPSLAVTCTAYVPSPGRATWPAQAHCDALPAQNIYHAKRELHDVDDDGPHAAGCGPKDAFETTRVPIDGGRAPGPRERYDLDSPSAEA